MIQCPGHEALTARRARPAHPCYAGNQGCYGAAMSDTTNICPLEHLCIGKTSVNLAAVGCKGIGAHILW